VPKVVTQAYSLFPLQTCMCLTQKLKILLHKICTIPMYNTNKKSRVYQSNLETNQAVTYYVTLFFFSSSS
jgi:hypothetical protein